jgi:hypothetical protein
MMMEQERRFSTVNTSTHGHMNWKLFSTLSIPCKRHWNSNILCKITDGFSDLEWWFGAVGHADEVKLDEVLRLWRSFYHVFRDIWRLPCIADHTKTFPC